MIVPNVARPRKQARRVVLVVLYEQSTESIFALYNITADSRFSGLPQLGRRLQGHTSWREAEDVATADKHEGTAES